MFQRLVTKQLTKVSTLPYRIVASAETRHLLADLTTLLQECYKYSQ